MTRDELVDAIHRAGLEYLARDLEQAMRPALRIRVRMVPEEALAIGVSKIGGTPDLPAGIPWPEWEGLPLQFLAQFALEEVTSYPLEPLLPPSGLLSFFLAPAWVQKGQPADPVSWRVLFSLSERTDLQQRALPAHFPSDYLYLLEPHALTYEMIITLPELDAIEGPSAARIAFEAERYAALLRQVQPDFGHQLLGHPHQVQGGPMPYWCELEDRRIAFPQLPEGKLETLARAGAEDWCLLFQLDEIINDEAGFGGDLGGDGVLYFWIRRQALQARDFSQICLHYQCT